MSFIIRPAKRSDIVDVARLVNLAIEGMPMAFWKEQSSAGQDPFEVGISRCKQDDTATSYMRTTLAELDSEIVGLILSHDIKDVPQDMENVHPMFRPMVRLVTTSDWTGSINTIAVYPKYRRRGIASALLNELEASSSGTQDVQGLLTSDANTEGHAFCEGRQYRVYDEAPVIKGPWKTQAANWQLRRKLHS